MSELEVRVPDLGDTKAATVVEVLVSVGAQIRLDDPLITLESEKASMDIPSSAAGVIATIAVEKGQEVSSGTLIATLKETAKPAAAKAPSRATARPAASRATPPRRRRPRHPRPRPRQRLPRPPPPRRPLSISSFWAPAPAAIRRHFGRRIWVSRSP